MIKTVSKIMNYLNIPTPKQSLLNKSLIASEATQPDKLKRNGAYLFYSANVVNGKVVTTVIEKTAECSN